MKRNTRKNTRQRLLNFYGQETYELNKGLSPKTVLRWLAEANHFLNKTIGIDQRLKNEAVLRKLGW